MFERERHDEPCEAGMVVTWPVPSWVAIEDLVAGLARDPELSAQIRHGLARESASYDLTLSSITEHSFHGIHFPPRKGRKCNLCVRYDLLPMSRVAHKVLS